MSDERANQRVDTLLRAAGASLRADAPSASEIAAAHERIDDRRPSRTWWSTPAVLAAVAAAAAAVVGIVAISGPGESLREVPGDPVTVPTAPVTGIPVRPVPGTDPTPGSATVPGLAPPATVPASAAVDQTAPATIPPASPVPPTAPAAATTAPPPPTTLPPATVWTVGTSTGYDFDGDGGVCLTLTGGPNGETATGCLAGEHVRAGRPAYAVFGSAILALTARLDGGGADLAELAVDAPDFTCLSPVDGRGRLVDLFACAGDAAIHTFLPTGPDGVASWSTTGWTGPAGVTVRPADVVVPEPFSVFEVSGDGGLSCTVVVDGDNRKAGWREACAATGTVRALLAGRPDRPVLVELGASGAVTTATALEPGTLPLANGCRVGIGVLFASLPAEAAMTGLHCVDGAAIAGFARVLVQAGPTDGGVALLRDAGNGTWPAGDTGPSLTCTRYAQTCAAFGASTELDEALLPVPRRSVLVDLVDSEVGPDVLDPRHDTERYAAIGPVGSEEALFAAVDAAWRSSGDDVSLSSPTFAGQAPLVVTFSRIPDDSLRGSVVVVWYSAGDGGLRIDAVVEILGCGRGTTTLDGAKVCV